MEKPDFDFNEILEDIRQIKRAIKQNSYIFRQLIYSPLMKLDILITGLTTLFVPFFYYILLKRYISYEGIPFEIRLLLIVGIIVGILLISAVKITFYVQARHQEPRFAFLKTLSRMISRQALLLYPGLVGTMLFFTFFFIMQHNSHFVLPTIAIGMGIYFSTIGSFVSVTEFFIFGTLYWIMGIISVPFIIVAPLTSLLWTSGIFGLGMLAFYFYLTFFSRLDKEQSDNE